MQTITVLRSSVFVSVFTLSPQRVLAVRMWAPLHLNLSFFGWLLFFDCWELLINLSATQYTCKLVVFFFIGQHSNKQDNKNGSNVCILTDVLAKRAR